jgi:TetR/AcrR family transcriptional repressor of nem operon
MSIIILIVKPSLKARSSMGHSRAEKAEHHDRILGLAAQRIREAGLDAINVAELMRSAGLTHGGFYRHFASREDLVAEALARAFTDGAARAMGGQERNEPRSAGHFVRGYLSKTHRDDPGHGCAITALAGDIGRADSDAKAILETHLKAGADALSRGLAEDEPPLPHGKALAIMAALVGGLTLARAVGDPHLSDLLLRSTRELALSALSS